MDNNNNENKLLVFTPEELAQFSETEIKVLQAALNNDKKYDFEKANEIGITDVWYCKVKNSEKIQKALATVRAKMLNETLFTTLQKAIIVLNQKLESKDEDIQLKASKQILDFSAKQTTNEVSTLNIEKSLI